MDAPFLPYLKLLQELSGKLDQLGKLAQTKLESVHNNDLMGLDDVLKQEQVISLALRGLEQKRKALLAQLQLENVPLAELARHYPKELSMQAKETTEHLRNSFQMYQSHARAARNSLELNLHQIEKVIKDAGIDPAEGVPGYDALGTEPPKNMKSDFRA